MKRINLFLIIISIILLGLISGNTLMLFYIRNLIEIKSVIQEWLGCAIAIFLILIALFHLLGLIGSIVQFKYFKRDSILKAATFVLGIFSLFLLPVDVVMLKDIGNEYMFSLNIASEWEIVTMGHFIHILFSLFLLIQSIDVSKRFSKYVENIPAVKDESVFLMVHQIGIISAVLGLLCIFFLNRLSVPWKYLKGLLFLSSIVILIPYGLATVFWIFTKRREKPVDWYDEKQFIDISRGALVTLIISVMTTIGYYSFLSYKIIDSRGIMWFPIYLFLTLLLFSGSTLYMSKRA